ncbi:sodium-dependent transporter [Alkaliflexus imshenetskii]|uniref:sodium-dependent transporter n=1 Tax=Alkaliflexus imshenetskii TaxID=286730 RepID=UPI000478F9DA|nr:sodium-dependent transporter [Alkaliflexus imshenetskii]
MADNNQLNSRDSFSSKFGVIAAAAGSAVGLGNIWRFPYVAGENGGGAFLLLNLAFILAIGVPVMLSELLIGRKAQLNIFGAFRKLAPGKPWYLVGLMGVGAAFMILSFYAVVAGWTLEYSFYALRNEFAGKSAEELSLIFDKLTGATWRPVVFMLIFMAISALIVRSGVKKGIERYTKILMPLLLVIIIGLAIRSLTLEGAYAGLEFLFRPDFSAIDANTVLEALGQAFFSLSLGMGVMATYGSYIKKSESLGQTAISVSLTDTFIAVLAGVAIFPAVFAFGIEPGAGPGLVFVTLPGIFNQMVGGYFFAVFFFVLLVIAALTSSISLLEVVVAYFVEELKMKRPVATWVAAGIMSLLGVLCALNGAIFNLFDKTSSNILLPLGGLFIVIFVGWFLGKRVVKAELEADGRVAFYFKMFVPVIRFLAPIAIALVFLNGIGLLKF